MADKDTIVKMIIKEAQAQDFDPALALAVAFTESNFNPKAQNKDSGAGGLFQFMPATAKDMEVADRFDPEQNIRGGIRYLKQNLTKYNGDVVKAVAAHNAGPGNVDKYGGVPPFKETQKYVTKIDGLYPEFKRVVAESQPTADAAPGITPEDVETLVKGSFQDLADPDSMKILEKAASEGHPAAGAYLHTIKNPEDPDNAAVVEKLTKDYGFVPVTQGEEAQPPRAGLFETSVDKVKSVASFDNLKKAVEFAFQAPGRALRAGVVDTVGNMFNPQHFAEGGSLKAAWESAKGGKAVDGKDIVRKVFGETAARLDAEAADNLEEIAPSLKWLRRDRGTGVLGTVVDVMSDPLTPTMFMGMKSGTPSGKIDPDDPFGKILQALPGFSKEQASTLLNQGTKVKVAEKGVGASALLRETPEAGAITMPQVAEKARATVKAIKESANKELQVIRSQITKEHTVPVTGVLDEMAERLGKLRITVTKTKKPPKGPIKYDPATGARIEEATQEGLALVKGKNTPVKNDKALKTLQREMQDLLANPEYSLDELLLKRQALDDRIASFESKVIGKKVDRGTALLKDFRAALNRAIDKAPKVPENIRAMDKQYAEKSRFVQEIGQLLGKPEATEKRLVAAIGPNQEFNQRLLNKLVDKGNYDVVADLLAISTAKAKQSIFPLSGGGGGGTGGQLVRGGTAASLVAKAGYELLSGNVVAAAGYAAGAALFSPKVMGSLAGQYSKLLPNTKLFLRSSLKNPTVQQVWMNNPGFRAQVIELAQEKEKSKKGANLKRKDKTK